MKDISTERVCLVLGIICATTIILFAASNDHIEEMSHIKQGHCRTQRYGTTGTYWSICK